MRLVILLHLIGLDAETELYVLDAGEFFLFSYLKKILDLRMAKINFYLNGQLNYVYEVQRYSGSFWSLILIS